MAETTPKTLEELAAEFAVMAIGEAKNAFFHAHPELAAIFNGIHFPKPEPVTAPAKTETTTT